jgi:hypothetical protein
VKFFDKEKKYRSDSDSSLSDDFRPSLSDIEPRESESSDDEWLEALKVDPKGYEGDTEDFHDEAKPKPPSKT